MARNSVRKPGTIDQRLWQPFAAKDYQRAFQEAFAKLDRCEAFDAIHLGALALIKSGQYEQGYVWAAASLQLVDANADWYVNAARAFMDEKQHPMALAIAQEGADRFPTDVRIAHLYAMATCAEGKF